MELWIDAFTHCHRRVEKGIDRIYWPDGKSYIEQENIVVEMFEILRSEYLKVIQKNVN